SITSNINTLNSNASLPNETIQNNLLSGQNLLTNDNNGTIQIEVTDESITSNINTLNS
ncbi:unnamed protein product, partial [Brachionus calyciflorus]